MRDMRDSGCPLCEGERRTRRYHGDEICWVADCSTCHRPMIVYRFHGEPTPGEVEHMSGVSDRLFPGARWRGYRRNIFDHWHEHIMLESGDIGDE